MNLNATLEPESISSALSEGLGPLFGCSQMKDLIRIRTPFLYPDGDVIDLFVKPYALEGGSIGTVTDLGETLRWLNSNTIATKRSPKQNLLIADITQMHGVQFFKGMLNLRFSRLEELAEAVTHLGQAAVRVSDLIFTTRMRSVESVTDEVADLLSARHLPYERNAKIVGRSGNVWKMSFHVSAPEKASYVNVLATGSQSAARQMAKNAVAIWHDLSGYKISGPIGFISLIDDSSDVWSPEDLNLIESISEVARWSEPDSLLQLLEA
jgi:hypothetical protein